MTIDVGIHDQVGLRLLRCDQRYTRLRRALIETMAGAGRPLTIPEILRTNPGLSQSSAYRNITVLIEAGCRAIDLAGSLDAAWAGMATAGVQRVSDLN